MNRPVEIRKDRRDGRWHWRCRACGLLRGSSRRTWPAALAAALAHLAASH